MDGTRPMMRGLRDTLEAIGPITMTLTPHGVDMFRQLIESIGIEWRRVLGMQGQAKE